MGLSLSQWLTVTHIIVMLQIRFSEWDYHVLTTPAFLRAKAWRKKHGGHGSKYGINELLSHVSFQRNARMLGSSADDLLTGWGKHCCCKLCKSGALLEYVQTLLSKTCRMSEPKLSLLFSPRCCHRHDCCYDKAEKEGCSPKVQQYQWACEQNAVRCGKEMLARIGFVSLSPPQGHRLT